MNNFTKSYIKECDCKEIQGLRTELDWMDAYCLIGLKEEILPFKFDNIQDRKDIAWLPTGDQLDEEIIKICKKKHYSYDFLYQGNDGYYAGINDYTGSLGENSRDNNPLIAKIKLLKNLLKEEK